MGFVLAGGLLIRGHIVWRKGEFGSSLYLSNRYISVTQEVVELLHQVLRYEV